MTLPRPQGDPAAARRIAAACRVAADETARALARTRWVTTALDRSWAGPGARARLRPLQTVLGDGRQVERGLRELADRLDDYARKLERAQEQHGWSLGRLITLGAIVATTAAAVVVTMGAGAVAAGSAEAALAAGALESAGEAATAAAAAEAELEAGMATSARMLHAVRALTAFAAPHLAQVELGAGVSAAVQEARFGRIDARGVALDSVLGLAGGGMASAVERSVRGARWFREAAPWVRESAPHIAATGVYYEAELQEQQWRGAPVDPWGALRDGVLDHTSSGLSDEVVSRAERRAAQQVGRRAERRAARQVGRRVARQHDPAARRDHADPGQDTHSRRHDTEPPVVQ